MGVQRYSAFEKGTAQSANGIVYPYIETPKAGITNAQSLPSQTHHHSRARSRFQPDLKAVEVSSEKYAELHATIRVDRLGGRWRWESSPYFEEYLDGIATPEFLKNLLDQTFLQEREAQSKQDPINEGEFLGAWQSVDTLSPRRSRLAKHSTRKRRFSSNHAPSLVKKRRTSAQVKFPSHSFTVTPNASEDDFSDEDYAVDRGTVCKEFKIGDEQAVILSYYELLDVIQQVPCKDIAKAWIKTIDPKKQAKNPYNGGKTKDIAIAKYGKENQGCLTMPEWWPMNCRHTEPDHIKKDERFILLIHLLRGGAKPCKDLEESTRNIDNERKSKTKKKKWNKPISPLLNLIYFIRKKEEAFLRGEMDGIATVSVEIPIRSKVVRSKKASKALAKSTGAKQVTSQPNVLVPRQTPKTFKPSQGSSPLLLRSGTHFEEPPCDQGLTGRGAIMMTPQSSAESTFFHEGLPYQATSGIPTPESVFQESHAQGVQMQQEPQAISFGGTYNSDNMDYGLETPFSALSVVRSNPARSIRIPFQQTPVVKEERPYQSSTSWPMAASSFLPQQPFDGSSFFQQDTKEMPTSLIASLSSGFQGESFWQENDLPFSTSQNTSYESNVQPAPFVNPYQTQIIPNYGSFSTDVDEQDYLGNYPYPSG